MLTCINVKINFSHPTAKILFMLALVICAWQAFTMIFTLQKLVLGNFNIYKMGKERFTQTTLDLLVTFKQVNILEAHIDLRSFVLK